jgi:hypothetical protein
VNPPQPIAALALLGLFEASPGLGAPAMAARPPLAKVIGTIEAVTPELDR